MDLPGAGAFYALAALAMAFTAFTAIVVVLRDSTGKRLSPLHILFTSIYVELGLMASAFGMLAPVLALCGISEILTWQISSAVALAILAPWLLCYPSRRKTAAPDESLPLRWYIMFGLGMTVVAALCLNIVGFFFDPGPGPLVIATAYPLANASVIFLRNYSSYFQD